MIRFGVVQLDEELVYNNGECSLKINSGDYTKGTLLMTARFVPLSPAERDSDFCYHLAISAGSEKTLRAAS
jgi:hypothetical protein